MPVKFNSQGCRTAANDLTKSAERLDTLLNSELDHIVTTLKQSYQSDTADKLYEAYEKMKSKFPEFVKSVADCSNYLNNTVAPAYEKIESTAASKIN